MKRVVTYSAILFMVILISCNNADKAEETQSFTQEEESSDQATGNKDSEYLEQGQQFVMQTQSELAKNLLNEINTKGTLHALTFCSAKAYPLTDSMAKSLDIRIKRVTDKARNPDNRANAAETAFIAKSKEMLAKGETIKAQITESDNSMLGYYPIMTNAMCLQCHGAPETDVQAETLSEIRKLYPEDKALDYKANELRGIWVVEMKK